MNIEEYLLVGDSAKLSMINQLLGSLNTISVDKKLLQWVHEKQEELRHKTVFMTTNGSSGGQK